MTYSRASFRPRKRQRYRGSSAGGDPEEGSGVIELDGSSSDRMELKRLSEHDALYDLWKSAWGKSQSMFEGSCSPVVVSDGDILPGKPFLETGLRGKILVRAEYRRIYNYVEESFAQAQAQAPERPAAVVVTGQPGIGKTCWAHYALRCRLAKEHRTVLYRSGQFYLFYESGVGKILDADAALAHRPQKEERWCFVDSADAPDRPPIAVTGAYSFGTNLVYTTSPWSKLGHTRRTDVVFMNPWTLEEVECVINDRKGNLETARERFKIYGPTARICFDLTDRQMRAYDDDLRSAVKVIKHMPVTMAKILEDADNSCMGDLTSKICLIRREEIEPVSYKTRLTTMSGYALDLCAARLLELDRNEILKTWALFPRYPEARGITGHVYEAFTHESLRTRIELKLESMFQHNNGSYHASFTDFANNAGLNQSFDPMTLEFTPAGSIAFKEDKQGFDVKPDVYYIPVKENQVGIDSFTLHDGFLYFFQMTVAASHDINSSFFDFTPKLRNIPNAEKWRFVFVFPDVLERFSCPNPIGNVGSLYTAKFSTYRE